MLLLLLCDLKWVQHGSFLEYQKKKCCLGRVKSIFPQTILWTTRAGRVNATKNSCGRRNMMMLSRHRGVNNVLRDRVHSLSACFHTRAALCQRQVFDTEGLKKALAQRAEEAKMDMAGAADEPASTGAEKIAKGSSKAPLVQPGEEVGHIKWLDGEEYVLREVAPGELGYVSTLKPGITQLMAFGERRGKKRGKKAYKGHISPYLRVSPKSPLAKLIVPEKDLVTEGLVRQCVHRFLFPTLLIIIFITQRLRLEWQKTMWPKSKKKPSNWGTADLAIGGA